jgi:hypothetical protein
MSRRSLRARRDRPRDVKLLREEARLAADQRRYVETPGGDSDCPWLNSRAASRFMSVVTITRLQREGLDCRVKRGLLWPIARLCANGLILHTISTI